MGFDSSYEVWSTDHVLFLEAEVSSVFKKVGTQTGCWGLTSVILAT
jgi:hypothetical protein